MSSFISFWRYSRVGALMVLLLWMAVIFSFSTLTGKATVGPPPLWYFLERKGAHVFEYAVLLFLSFRFFRLSFTQESLIRVLMVAALFSLAYGATDELHQFFVPLRGSKLSDVGIDGMGILIASLLVFFWHKKKHRQ
jgi:VanZ family protein